MNNLQLPILILFFASLFTSCTNEKVGWKFSRSLPIGAPKHGHNWVSSPTHPTRFGQFSQQFLVKPGDCSRNNSGWSDCNSDRERAELLQTGEPNRQVEGDRYWYRWSILLPKTHRSIPKMRMYLGQFDQEGKNCEPSFMFQEIKGEYLLRIMPNISEETGNYQTLINNENFIGKWNDIVIDAFWTKKNNGWFNVWINGEQKVSYAGKTMSCDEVYFKYGIYRSRVSLGGELSKSITTTAYYDGVIRSKTKKKMFMALDE